MTQQQSRYSLIPRTLTFITNHSNQLLLVRNNPTKHIWPNLYNGIGGHIEARETIIEGAKREVAEETGITQLHHLTLRAIITVTQANPDVLIFVFTAQTATKRIIPSDEGTPEWIPITSVYTLPLVPDLPELLPRIFPATNQQTNLVYGHYTITPDTKMHIRFL